MRFMFINLQWSNYKYNNRKMGNNNRGSTEFYAAYLCTQKTIGQRNEEKQQIWYVSLTQLNMLRRMCSLIIAQYGTHETCIMRV